MKKKEIFEKLKNIAGLLGIKKEELRDSSGKGLEPTWERFYKAAQKEGKKNCEREASLKVIDLITDLALKKYEKDIAKATLWAEEFRTNLEHMGEE